MDQVLPGFRVLGTVGSGTQGTVYLVESVDLGRRYALKIFTRRGEEARQITESSLRALLLLRHPRILTPHQAGFTPDGRPYLLLSFIERDDPRSALALHGPAGVLALLVQALAGLAYLHGQGMTHADLKPPNILVRKQAGEPAWNEFQLFISDIEMQVSSVWPPHKTPVVTGTLGYIAPEIMDGERASPCTDVFSLGAWLYWLITGQEPFVGGTVEQSLARLRSGATLPPAGRFDQRFASAFWDQLLEGMTASDPSDRFANAGEVLAYVAGHPLPSPEATREIPRLLHNPFALTREEAELCDQVAASLVDAQGTPALVVIRTARRGAAGEIARRSLARTGAKYLETVIVTPGILPRVRNDRLLDSSASPVIVDDSGFSGRFDDSDLIDALRLLQLSRVGSGGRRTPVLLLQGPAPGGSRVERQEEALKTWNVRVHQSHPPDAASEEVWLGRLFSGLPVDLELRESVKLAGCRDMERLEDALFHALRDNVLVARDGKISLDDSARIGFLASLRDQTTKTPVGRNPILAACLELLGRVPFGLSADSRATIHKVVAGAAIVEQEIIDSGLARIDDRSGAMTLTVLSLGERPELAPSSELVFGNMVRALVAGISPPRLQHPATPELIALGVLQPTPPDNLIRRAIAYGQCLLRSSKPQEALAILRAAPDFAASRRGQLLKARWLETRSRAWEAFEEFDRLVSDRREAIDLYESHSCPLLAARAAISLALAFGGRDLKPEAEAAFRESRSLLARSPGRTGAAIKSRLRAEDSQNLRWTQRFAEAGRAAQEVLNDPLSDNGARAIAHRVLGLIALQDGDTLGARQNFALGILLARRSRDPRVMSQVLAAVAGFEFSRGFYARSAALNRRILSLPAAWVRATERHAALSGQGGAAYEAGRMQEALSVNLRALASANLVNYEARQSNAAYNIGLVLLEMGQLANSLSMLELALEKLHALKPTYASDPRTPLLEAYLEIGSVTDAEECVIDFEQDKRRADSPMRRGFGLRGRCMIERFKGDLAAATQYAVDARAEFERIKALDEVLKIDFLLLELAYPETHPPEACQRLAELESRAAALRNWRLLTRFRLARLTWDESVDAAARLAELNGLMHDCYERGYAILDLPMLELKARLLIRSGARLEAQDVLREAIGRIRSIASDFANPRLKDIYLKDPRRQVFLELTRATRTT